MSPIEKVPRDWLEHGFTCLLRRRLEEQQRAALAALIAVARESSDPKVTKKCADYEQLGSFLGQLGKERADDDDRADGD